MRELPSIGMRYFVRTETLPRPTQHISIKGSASGRAQVLERHSSREQALEEGALPCESRRKAVGDPSLAARARPKLRRASRASSREKDTIPRDTHPTAACVRAQDNLQNFRDDADYSKVYDSVCRARVHRGFLRVADAVWRDARGASVLPSDAV